jgi:Fe-coproporphyrin III synthase
MNTRRFGLVKDIVLLNAGRSSPFRMTLMVSEECPLRCRTCGIWRAADPRAPSLEEIERLFRSNRRLSWVNLTGGEVFLRPDVGEIFEIALAALPRLALLNIPTAGQDPERIAADVERGLAAGLPRLVVTVSFDGGRTSHDHMRGRDGAFDRARESFRALTEIAARSGGRFLLYPGLTLSADLLALSPAPLEDLARDLDLEGCSGIHLNIAHTAGHYYRNESLPALPPQDAARTINRALKSRNPKCSHYDRVGKRAFSRSRAVDLVERIYLGGAIRYLKTGRPPLPCKALAGSVFIDAGLNVYPCTIFDRPVGNLRNSDYSLETLRMGKDWRDARRAIAAGRCPGCWTPCEACPAITGNALSPRGLVTILKTLAEGRGKRE